MIPTRIGQVLGGGTFTGFNRIRNQIYGIILAPKSTETVLPQKRSLSETDNTQSTVDGFANTVQMNDLEHPAAYYCANLTANGFADWYLPSMNELEICYRYLKPTIDVNTDYVTQSSVNFTSEVRTNSSSIPTGMPYTCTTPAQTTVPSYRADSKEAFDLIWYWTSTESSKVKSSMFQIFSYGSQESAVKIMKFKVRAVRRELIVQIKD